MPALCGLAHATSSLTQLMQLTSPTHASALRCHQSLKPDKVALRSRRGRARGSAKALMAAGQQLEAALDVRGAVRCYEVRARAGLVRALRGLDLHTRMAMRVAGS